MVSLNPPTTVLLCTDGIRPRALGDPPGPGAARAGRPGHRAHRRRGGRPDAGDRHRIRGWRDVDRREGRTPPGPTPERPDRRRGDHRRTRARARRGEWWSSATPVARSATSPPRSPPASSCSGRTVTGASVGRSWGRRPITSFVTPPARSSCRAAAEATEGGCDRVCASAGVGGWWAATKPESGSALRKDAVAGIPGAIGSVPDGMAPSVLVGVNPVFGLYASFAGPIAGGLSSSSRLMVVTTTSAAALAAGSALSSLDPADRPGALFLLTRWRASPWCSPACSSSGATPGSCRSR